VKDAVTFVAAFGLMIAARKFDRRRIHGICLALGGVAWASILSMPYAILSGSLPEERMGVYMGIFNFFIVLPEIIAALTFGLLVKNYLGGNLVHATMAGGFFMLLAAALAQWVKPSAATKAA
jgi:maltose/moltooligosaccharide transporter